MEVPGQLEINNKVYQFSDLNRYQRQIYVELVRAIKAQQKLKANSLDSVRQEGVIGFLYGRLESYAGLDKITNIYCEDVVTPGEHKKA